MIEFDFDDLLEKVNNAVISIVNIFNVKELTDIEKAKDLIKELYLDGNLNEYHDYKDSSFEVIESLLSYRKRSDFMGFYMYFFTSTFLIIPTLKIGLNDELMQDRISEVIHKLYEEFEN